VKRDALAAPPRGLEPVKSLIVRRREKTRRALRGKATTDSGPEEPFVKNTPLPCSETEKKQVEQQSDEKCPMARGG